MKNFLTFAFLLSLFLVSATSLAFPALVNEEGSQVFEQPDFDSKVIFNMHAGQKIEVSKRVFPGKNGMAAFHRIKTEDGKLGFVTDAEFSSTNSKEGKALAKAAKESKAEMTSQAGSESPRPKQRPFSLTKYRGVTIDYVGYREQTMGFNPMANVVFYGFRAVGPNLMVEGDMVTELNVSILPGAPPFYQEATLNTANGWILHSDVIFESVFPQTSEVSTYMGFGPMFKYDNYTVAVTSAGKTSSFNLNDMDIGAVFNLGFALRMGKACLRTEFKYNWEKTQYWGLGTALLFQF